MNDARITPLSMQREDFRALGHQLVDRIADHLESMPGRPVAPPDGVDDLRALLGTGSIPENGTAPDALLAEASRLLFEHSTFNGHPRFFGYITAGPAPIGILGDLLASALNPNCGGWTLSPMAS